MFTKVNKLYELYEYINEQLEKNEQNKTTHAQHKINKNGNAIQLALNIWKPLWTVLSYCLNMTLKHLQCF